MRYQKRSGPDYGRGIPDDRKKDIFTRYMKGASGIGLGLALVLALAKSYSGDLVVKDRVKGDYTQGTVFIVYLPEFKRTW